MTDHRQKLRGVLTAIVTPMNRDGSVDFAALDALVDWQLAEGVQGLVPCGTAGEAVTLTAEERSKVTERVVERVRGRATVIAGAGSNSTAAAIEAQKRAKDTGPPYSLVVTPYYNKPTPEGLYRHYAELAAAVDLPIVLYNVPGRTGCDMKPATVARLAELENIVAIKEASADLDRVGALRATTPPGFVLLSGDDGTACAFTLLGGDGVISVTSNCAPRSMARMIGAALNGDVAAARAGHDELRDLFAALFWESNPIPVKAALALAGRIQEHYRLPLCEMSRELVPKLRRVLEAGGWVR